MLRTRCIDGVIVNKDVCERYVRESVSVAALLDNYIGYRVGDEVDQEVARSDKSACDITLEQGLLNEIMVDRLLSFKNLSYPGEQKAAGKG